MRVRITKIRLFLWFCLFLTAIFLLSKAVVPGGKIIYATDFKNESDFIRKITPAERTADNNVIIGDPVYFSLVTPRAFDKAKINVIFERLAQEDNYPIIEIGALVDKTVWRYDLGPLQNKIVDDLMESWDVIAEDDLVFLQKEKNFDSISDFISSSTPRSEISLYNYNLHKEFLIDSYSNNEPELRQLPVALRGTYEFYTYVKDEELNFQFAFTDLNLNKDPDKIEILLFYENELIAGGEVADDGVMSDTGVKTEKIFYEFKQARLQEGVYKLEVKVNNDIITDSIKTLQKKISFINKIWINDYINNLSLITDSRIISAQTTNPASLQTVVIQNATRGENSQTLEMNKTYELFSSSSPFEISKIVFFKNDIIISGDGVFGFDLESFVSPNFKKVDRNFDVETINYVIARYAPPNKENNILTAQTEVDLKKAYREVFGGQLGGSGAYSFIISIPGLRSEDGFGIRIKEIKVELSGKSLFEKIRGFVH